MNADFKEDTPINRLTEKVIGCAFKVANTLGSGFLEKVYENALAYELRKSGVIVDQQIAIQVRYDGELVGDFYADLLIEHKLLVELKAVKALDQVHKAQCINYLKATSMEVCLLINFGNPKIEYHRLTNSHKNALQVHD